MLYTNATMILRDQFLILETILGVYIESNAIVLKGIEVSA